MTRSRLLADTRWLGSRSLQTFRTVAVTPRRELPSDLPRRVNGVRRLGDVRVPLHDGVALRADVYLPEAAGPFPAVLIRMPYGKRQAYCYMPAHGRYWARLGYACVIQDVRGRWSSEGTFRPFVSEAQDGWDTLDWVAAQPWCTGDVGMTGESYYGYTQWAVAALGHPALRCIAPGDTAADISSSWVYNGGAFCHQTMGRWAYDIDGRRDHNEYRFDPWHLPLAGTAAAAGHPNDTYTAWATRAHHAASWDDVDVDGRHAGVTVPALHWGGWYDMFLSGTIDGWRGVRQSAAPAVSSRQFLSLAATDHEMTPEFSGRIGRHELHGHGYAHDRVAAFMDEWLRDAGPATDGAFGPPAAAGGLAPRVTTGEPVRYFTMVRNVWHTATDWPPPGVVARRLHLRGNGHANGADGDGRLSWEPAADEPADRFLYDPDRPLTYWLDANLWEAARYLKDRRPLEQRADVLVYTSEVLDRDLEITGPLSATLHVSTSADDTDFTVALVDVFPDGHAHLVQEGVRRLRYRDGGREPAAVEPGRTYEIGVDLWATSYVVARGHRLRVEVSSSNFDRYDRNLNTGDDSGWGTELAVAAQTVYHDERRPSYLTVSIADR